MKTLCTHPATTYSGACDRAHMGRRRGAGGGSVHFVELACKGTIASGARTDLPPFLGATLRGAFGHVLKSLVCQVAHGQCSRCFLRTACPYSTIFEGLGAPERPVMRRYERVPQPFVLLVPGPDEPARGEADGGDADELHWGIRLFGPARRYWPYTIHAFQTAGEQGLGARRLKVDLRQVRDANSGEVVWADSEAPTVPEPQPLAMEQEMAELPADPDEPCTLRWRFHTPVRLRHNGQLNPRDLDGLSLLLAARRRYRAMARCYEHEPGPPESIAVPDVDDVSEPWLDADSFQTLECRLHRWGFDRWSGRQRRRMRLEGLTGELVVRGPWGRAGSALAAAPALHLGKATSFGFGRVGWERV